jgi:invasion protein IalB
MELSMDAFQQLQIITFIFSDRSSKRMPIILWWDWRLLVLAFMIVACAILSTPTKSFAQEVVQKTTVGDWTVYCLKKLPNPKPQDCSIVTAVKGTADTNAWLRVAIAFESSLSDISMTIRTPQLKFFGKGISIRSDGNQLGRAFIERCYDSFCETTVRVDPRTLWGLAAAQKASFEYQISDDESIALAVNLEQFVPALGELARVLGFVNPLKDKTFIVELRTKPSAAANSTSANAGTKDIWGRPIECFGSAATKAVVVSADFRIRDDQNFDEWLSRSARCADNNAVWIYGDSHMANTALGELSRYAVYKKVRGKVTNVFLTDSSGQIPLRPLW